MKNITYFSKKTRILAFVMMLLVLVASLPMSVFASQINEWLEADGENSETDIGAPESAENTTVPLSIWSNNSNLVLDLSSITITPLFLYSSIICSL